MQLRAVCQSCRRESSGAIEAISVGGAGVVSIRRPPQFTGLFSGATLGFS